MHLEVLVRAVGKELLAPRSEVGEPGDVLLGRQGGCLVEMKRGHRRLLTWAVSHRSLPQVKNRDSHFGIPGAVHWMPPVIRLSWRPTGKPFGATWRCAQSLTMRLWVSAARV